METQNKRKLPACFLNYLALLIFTFQISTTLCQTDVQGFAKGKIWIKLKQDQPIPRTIKTFSDLVNSSEVPALSAIARLFNLKSIKSPFHQSGSDKLNRILCIEFNDHDKVNVLMKQLEHSGLVEYVEQIPVDMPCFVPNDPSYASQWSLAKINAPAAWDISTGSANIVVAVVDNAIQTTHPDLQPNIWVNPGEIAGDGIDNDNNGYIDDINGYDVADNNNNPNPPSDAFDHGTHVAGIISAKSNNSIGIASIGSNIKLMCVKIAPDASDVLTGGTPGIYYAALNGARVINCSFGSTAYSTTRQAIIDWAYNRGSIVVSVAGNSGINNKLYPGAMNNVVCVTATNSSDAKEPSSTYGNWVDVSAPGTGIYSTIPTNSYATFTGTSMAAPAVSGLLGLILSVNPNLTQDEAINCLKSTTDNIDALNPSYTGMMGTGRINALAALQCAQSTVFALNASPIWLSSGTTCSTTVPMQVVIRNVGTSTLTSLSINYKIDNNTASVYNWSGSLASGAAASVTLPSPTFTFGKHTFTVYTSTPNGGTDGYIKNDTIKSSLNVVQTGLPLPFVEGFEGTFPPPDWGLGNPDGGLTWGATAVAKYSGNISAVMLNYYDPFYGSTDYLTTPVLDLTSVSNPAISFMLAYQPRTGYPSDTLIVLVSTDCGKTYGILLKKWGSALSTVAGTTSSTFIPSGTAQWRNEAYLLPPLVASSKNAIFVFMNKGAADNNIFLDDIIFTGVNMAAGITIAQTAGTNTICAGESVTFTATPTNGGTAPTYQWQIDGANVGTNSPTFTTTSLTNGQQVTCIMTSNMSGVTGNPATSNIISITVNPTLSPSVATAITSGSNPACAGASVTFTATPVNGGSSPAYQWQINGVNVGTNSSVFTTSSLTNGQVVTCILTSNAACANPVSAKSSGITVTVNPTLSPSVSTAITLGSNPACAGTSLTFTATPTNGGTSPTYQWQINGVNVGTNSSSYTTSSLTNGQIVTCIVTSNALCANPVSATSSGITMSINPTVTPAVSTVISAGSNPTCAGTSVTFTATPTNGGNTPSYQWKVNGINTGTNSTSFTSTTLANGDVVTCELTSNATCANPVTATSTGITMNVSSVLTPAVTTAITTGSNPGCAGASVTFTATPSNGGTSPSYQWKVDGVNSGTNSPTFTTNSLTNGQLVICEMTSGSACASPSTAASTGITMTISPTVPAGITTALTSGTNPSCAGTFVTFTATPSNGGTSPSYQWKVDGVNTGTNSATFTTSTLTNGQIITCVLTSNSSCASPATATSSDITITIIPAVLPAVSATLTSGTNPSCEGESLTFTASPSNGGTTPSYHWQINGVTVGTNSSSYTTSSLTNGQVLTCILTSNAACANPVTSVSSGITVTVNSIPATPVISQAGSVLTSSSATGNQWYLNGTLIPGAVNQNYKVVQNGEYTVIVTENGCSSDTSNKIYMTTVGVEAINNSTEISVFPNPSNGNFTINFNSTYALNYTVEIINTIGKIVYSETLTGVRGNYSKQITINGAANEIYLLKVNNGNSIDTKKIVLQ